MYVKVGYMFRPCKRPLLGHLLENIQSSLKHMKYLRIMGSHAALSRMESHSAQYSLTNGLIDGLLQGRNI
jgi:hypothetical protein